MKTIDNAFNGCSALREITCLPIVPPNLTDYDNKGSYLGSGLKLDNIYVPAVSVDAYKVAEKWSEYADKIKAIQDN